MTTLLPSRRRAERLAVLVDDLTVGDASETDHRFEPLLETVGAVRVLALTAPEPRPEFVHDLRERLMAEADTALVPTHERLLLTRSGRRPARLAAAGAALVLAGGTAGIAVAAESSLPGESLYTLKQGLETAGRTLQLDDAARGRVELGQATTRLDEAQELVRRGETGPLADTLKSFDASAGSGADRLFTAYQGDADPADVTEVRTFAAAAMQQLGALAHSAPRSDRPALLRAADLVSSLDQEAQVLCPECGSSGPLMAPAQLTAAPTSLDLPPAVESAVGEATQAAKSPRPRTRGSASKSPTRTPSSAVGTPSSGTSSGGGAGATSQVTKAGGAASTTVKNTLPGSVGSTLDTVANQATTAVAGAVDAAVGVVGNTASELLGSSSTPKP